MPRLVHPPYSPDLSPCDLFFLFGDLKYMIEGKNFSSEEELLKEVIRILKGINEVLLQSVYDEWVWRLKECIRKKGEYID